MRAKPLPPDERRAAIIAVARPLVQRGGPSVSTRDVAEAAGIAEGTLFRVFETKDALIEAVLADVMDPTASCVQIRGIAPDQPLAVRIERVVDVLTERIREVTGFFVAMRLAPRDHSEEKERTMRETHAEHNRMVNEAIVDVIGADADLLRVSAAQAAQLVWSLSFVVGHPMMGTGLDLSPAATAEFLLHGVLSPEPDLEPSLTQESLLDTVKAG